MTDAELVEFAAPFFGAFLERVVRDGLAQREDVVWLTQAHQLLVELLGDV